MESKKMESTKTEYKKNDVLTVKIEDIGSDGEGIGKIEGYTLFIKDAVIGDTVSCKIMKTKKKYGYARLEEVLEPSPVREEAVCSFHRQCGGCQIQAMSYPAQLEYKQNKIRNSLLRIGGFAPELVDQVMDPIVGMDERFHYRNKAQFPVGMDRQGNIITGFYAGRTHSIIANTDCALGAAENKEILEIVLEHMRIYDILPYEHREEYHRDHALMVRHVLIRKGFDSGEIMVCLVIDPGGQEQCRQAGEGSGLKTGSQKSEDSTWIPGQEALIRQLAGIPGMKSISVSIHREKTNVIMGKEIHTLWGEDGIMDTLYERETSAFERTGRGIRFQISPLSFYQINPVQTEKLYSLALEYAGLTGKETVWDLYCGIGTISLFLAEQAKQVYGVEVIPEAIRDARENAARNGIKNAEFYVGKAEEVLPEKYETEGIYADVIVVDPPRKGCDEAALATMLRMQPERIVYVSCDPATLARDLKVLCEGGYELKRVRGVDQFGETVHVESVCLLSKAQN